MVTMHQLLAVLSRHIGAQNGISADELAATLGTQPRHVRTLVTELRDEGAAVCAHPTTGYFMAADGDELERYYIAYIESRALHGLRLVARTRRIALPDYLGQLKLPT